MRLQSAQVLRQGAGEAMQTFRFRIAVACPCWTPKKKTPEGPWNQHELSGVSL